MNSSDDNRPGHRVHEPFERHARALWRAAVRQIDPDTAGHLRTARRRALRETDKPARHAARWLIPSGAVAAFALAAMMVWQPLPHAPSLAPGPQPGIAALPLDNELPPDAEHVDPALYQNLDFYAWLAANDKPSSAR